MMKVSMTVSMIESFLDFMKREEKSSRTIRKYRKGLERLLFFLRGKKLDKEMMIAFKEMLCSQGYQARTINGFLAAANGFLKFQGFHEARVKNCHIQREVFRPESRDLSKEEYKKLLDTAQKKGKERLYYIMKTIYSTGIRIGELVFSTVEAVRKGYAEIQWKGKVRVLIFPTGLQKELLQYAESKQITEGIIFRTRSGKPVDRSNIWKEMKKLGDDVQKEEKVMVAKSKIFPHNLRHLFAKNFYEASKDIAKLADILGHSSIETTRIYIQTNYGEYRKLMDKMECTSSYSVLY